MPGLICKDHLDNYGDLRLDIGQFSISYRNNTVYENDDAKDSLAFRINSDGIISITILEDVENKEIYELLDVISQERSQETDDDIVTQLWTKSLSHINYEISDEADEAIQIEQTIQPKETTNEGKL